MPASQVAARFNQVVGSQPALTCSWTTRDIWHDGTTSVIRADGGRIVATSATWGRSDRQGDQCYVDDASPSNVRRGLLAVTSFAMTETPPDHSRRARNLSVSLNGQAWFLIGVSLNPFQPHADFAILTTTNGPDLQGLVTIEPLIVPPSHWAAFLDPESGAYLGFRSRPGLFNVQVG